MLDKLARTAGPRDGAAEATLTLTRTGNIELTTLPHSEDQTYTVISEVGDDAPVIGAVPPLSDVEALLSTGTGEVF